MLHRLQDVETMPSPGFVDWLEATGAVALVRAGRLTFVGLDGAGELALDVGGFRLASGVARHDDGRLWLAADRWLWRLEDALAGATTNDGHDRLYLPQVAWTTGALGAGDVAVDADGRVLLVSARLSAVLAHRPDGRLDVAWQPPWISALAPDERCQLSGLALVDGRPAFATSGSTSDAPGGWRAHRRQGGVVVDVRSGEVVASGLSLPHGPRWHDGRLWVVNTGAGEVGIVDLDRGRFEPVARFDAMIRGAAVVGRHLVLGAGRTRQDRAWADLPLGARLDAAGVARPAMGVFVLDLGTGEVLHRLTLEGSPREVFSLAVLPGVRRARAVDPDGDEAQELVSYEPPGW